MMNTYNKRLAFAKLRARVDGRDRAFAPPNRLATLSDSIEPEKRIVACPNQDVVFGRGVPAFDEGPAVMQAPDFGNRFWVSQVVDVSA
jgi:hypothetical protein